MDQIAHAASRARPLASYRFAAQNGYIAEGHIEKNSMVTPIRIFPARSIVLAVICVLASTAVALADGGPADQAMAGIAPQAIRANMRFLADDLLEGRGTATRGHEVAAMFMATRFEAMGLVPAGDAGAYLQRVPLRSMKTDAGKSAMTWVRAGKEEIVPAEDCLLRPDPSRHSISVRSRTASETVRLNSIRRCAKRSSLVKKVCSLRARAL